MSYESLNVVERPLDVLVLFANVVLMKAAIIVLWRKVSAKDTRATPAAVKAGGK